MGLGLKRRTTKLLELWFEGKYNLGIPENSESQDQQGMQQGSAASAHVFQRSGGNTSQTVPSSHFFILRTPHTGCWHFQYIMVKGNLGPLSIYLGSEKIDKGPSRFGSVDKVSVCGQKCPGSDPSQRHVPQLLALPRLRAQIGACAGSNQLMSLSHKCLSLCLFSSYSLKKKKKSV